MEENEKSGESGESCSDSSLCFSSSMYSVSCFLRKLLSISQGFSLLLSSSSPKSINSGAFSSLLTCVFVKVHFSTGVSSGSCFNRFPPLSTSSIFTALCSPICDLVSSELFTTSGAFASLPAPTSPFHFHWTPFLEFASPDVSFLLSSPSPLSSQLLDIRLKFFRSCWLPAV